jgi:histidinol-phosphatase (PHP family)
MTNNYQSVTTDYHLHSTFSPDGQATIEALCWRALALGLDTIAVTDHAEWQPGWDVGYVGAYLAELNRCREQFAPLGLTVLTGVEMGNPHQHAAEAEALLAQHPLAVRIASLHWLYGRNIHMTACFDGRRPQEVYADYFLALGQMAGEFEAIDIVAHFDRILWRGHLLGAGFDPVPLEPLIRDTLATIAQRDIALELNTRLLDHVPNWRPALVTMLGWFVDEGGRHVVVNSDAHHVNDMAVNVDLATDLLREVGLTPARLPARLPV